MKVKTQNYKASTLGTNTLMEVLKNFFTPVFFWSLKFLGFDLQRTNQIVITSQVLGELQFTLQRCWIMFCTFCNDFTLSIPLRVIIVVIS